MLTIKTNNVARDVIYGLELTEDERKEFDYYKGEELDGASFFRYKGCTYDLGEFFTVPDLMHAENPSLSKWVGYQSDSFFSGIVVRYVENFERVIVGTYFS